jgi:hypothetical protein
MPEMLFIYKKVTRAGLGSAWLATPHGLPWNCNTPQHCIEANSTKRGRLLQHIVLWSPVRWIISLPVSLLGTELASAGISSDDALLHNQTNTMYTERNCSTW